MKASWTGYLALGNLKVPVKLYSGVRSATPTYVQLHAKDHSETGRAIKCLKEDKEIPASETVRAVKAGDAYIEITDKEIRSVHDGDKMISVRQFSDPCAIKPKYYDKPYFIVPDEGGELAYTLLRQAFVQADKIAIATYTYYQKPHIGMIHVDDGMLVLQQLRFSSELVPRSDIKTKALPQPSPAETDVAIKLMQRYSTPFYLEDYPNEQADRINEFVERKAKGLAPKRYKSIEPQATDKDDVLPALRELLKSSATDAFPKG